MIADMEEVMRRGVGGVKIKGRKIYTLVYADDIVLIAEEEGEMKSMLERLEKYLDGKGLELNGEKQKKSDLGQEGGEGKGRSLHGKEEY